MNDNSNPLFRENLRVLKPEYADRAAHANIIQRRALFANWMSEQGLPWFRPDLTRFARYLEQERGLAKHSVRVYVSAVRSFYKELQQDPEMQEKIRQAIRLLEPNANVAEVVGQALTAIGIAATDAPASKNKVKRASHRYLTQKQVNELLRQPDASTLTGKRDMAALALLFCTGIRDVELVNLKVEDLRHTFEGSLALHVPDCSQCTERLIPYGELDWVLNVVDNWLWAAGIEAGNVFYGFHRGEKLRQGKFSVRALHDILRNYSIPIGEETYSPKISDIRHSYARNLYLSGVPIETIHHNLGFSTKTATLEHIGALDRDAAQTTLPKIYRSPFQT